MNLFIGSISVICAFVIGGIVGARIMSRFFLRTQGTLNKMLENASARSHIATAYTYEKIHDKIVEGLSMDELHRYVDAKMDSLRQRSHDLGYEAGIETAKSVHEEKS